jgi:hypothetical protein
LSHAWGCRGTACRAGLAHVPLGWLATILHVRIRRAEGETLDAGSDVGVERHVREAQAADARSRWLQAPAQAGTACLLSSLSVANATIAGTAKRGEIWAPGTSAAALEEREVMNRSVLERAADPADFLATSDGERAVAAAALVVAQHPSGQVTCSNYGPSEPLPELPADLRTLAVDALDQVVSERSELAELWDDAANGSKWRHDITRLRDVLAPPVPRGSPQSIASTKSFAQAARPNGEVAR